MSLCMFAETRAPVNPICQPATYWYHRECVSLLPFAQFPASRSLRHKWPAPISTNQLSVCVPNEPRPPEQLTFLWLASFVAVDYCGMEMGKNL